LDSFDAVDTVLESEDTSKTTSKETQRGRDLAVKELIQNAK